MKRFIVLDCETGGTDLNFSLLTLYAEILDEQFNVLDSIDLKIRPDDGLYCVKASALAINNINIVEHDKEAMSQQVAAECFQNFISCHTIDNTRLVIVGHNVGTFDVPFIKKNLFKKDWDRYFFYRYLDTSAIGEYLSMAGVLPSDMNASLANLAAYFGFDYSGAHEAKFDTQLTKNIFIKMINLIQKKPDQEIISGGLESNS